MRELFETLVRTTSFGICNVTARALTISAPVIATSHQPIPLLIVAIFSGIAAVLSMMARTNQDEDLFKDSQIAYR